MPARTNYEKAVCPSVKRVICDKMKESSAHILIPHEESFILVWWQEVWFLRGQPLLPEILGQTGPVGAKTLIFNRYSLVAPQP